MIDAVRGHAAGSAYHGWRVVAALFAAGVVVYGGGLYSFVLFVTPLTAEYHWSRAATAGIVSAFWLAAPLIVFGGRACERVGLARLAAAGVLIEAGCVVALAGVSSLWQMYVLRAAMGFGKLLFAVTIPATVGRWFSRRFAFALGIAWAGWHVGGALLSPAVAWTIERFTWRGACLALGAALVLFAYWPMRYAHRRASPRELGLGPDGDAPVAAAAPAGGTVAGPVPGVLAIVTAPAFAWIALATVAFYAAYGGLLAHQSAIVEAAGYSLGSSSLVLGSTAAFAAVGGLGVGWAIDRLGLVPVAFVLHAAILAGPLALLALGATPGIGLLVGYAACFGLAIGGSDIFFVSLMRARFPGVGLEHAYSAWYSVELLTLLLAPIAAGRVYDLTGSYHAVLVCLAVAAGAAMVATTLALRSPRAGFARA